MTTIATFGKPEEAHLLRMRLESAGFEAFVQNEYGAQTLPIYGSGGGEVRVEAADEDVEAIRQFLNEDAATHPKQEEE